MIDGISGNGVPVGMGFMQQQNTKLTDDQRSQLQDILSNYDPANMSDEDKMSIMEELKSSGIRPSKEVKGMIEDAGFEVGRPPEGPSPGGGRPPKADYIMEAVDKYESGELTEDDLDTLMEMLSQNGESAQGVFIDQIS